MPFTVRAPDETIRLFVTNDLLALRIKPQRAGKARGDVAEVTERGREMASFNVGVGPFVVLDAVEEIAVVRRALYLATEFFAKLIARPKQLPAAVLAKNHHAFRPIKRVAVFVAFLDVRRPDALLEDELFLLPNVAAAAV